MRFWQKKLGHSKIYDIFGLLVFGSFFGLVLETLYMYLLYGQWVNRQGLFFLPLCPLYGLALAVFALMPASWQKSDLRLWLAGCVGGSVLEYAASWMLEKLFHLRWWDYSDLPWNLEGRIWLPMSAAWGLAAILCSHWIARGILRGLKKLPVRPMEIAFTILLVLITIDSTLTVLGIMRFANRHNIMQRPSWLSTEAISRDGPVVAELDRTLFSDENLRRVFPYMAAQGPDGKWFRLTTADWTPAPQVPPAH